MRWIFFVLLGANVALLAWLSLRSDAASSGPTVSADQSSSAPTIQLLREAGVEQTPGSARLGARPAGESLPSASPDGSASAPVDVNRQPLCSFIGPFPGRDQAAQLAERLAAMDVPAAVTDVEIPAGPGYWVYLEPLDSRREALRYLADLQSRGIDSYIIPKGELENGISLGMFSKEPLAQARLQEVRALGVEAEIDVIERSYKEIWLSVPEEHARRLGESGWQRLLEDNNSVNHKQNFCLHVASQDNIH